MGDGAPPESVLAQARYRLPDGLALNMSLAGPAPRLDVDGEHRLAYRLEVSAQEEAPFWERTYHLDGAFRVARIDSPCDGDDSCLHALMDWSYRGLLAPYGIGLPHAVDEGENELWIAGARHAAFVQATDIEGGLRVEVQPIATLSYDPLDASGEFTFVRSRLFPEEVPFFHHGTGESHASLEWVREAPALPAIPAWPRMEYSPYGERSGLLYPDADAPLFNHSFSALELLDAALEADARASSLYNRGCLLVIYAPKGYLNEFDGVVMPVSREYQYTVIVADSSTRRNLDMRRSEFLGQIEYAVEHAEEGETEDDLCRTQRITSGPTLSWLDFMARTPRLSFTHAQPEEEYASFGYSAGTPYDSLEEGFGPDEYRYDRLDQGDCNLGVCHGRYYGAVMWAGPGWWSKMDVHPDDVEILDGFEGRI